MDTKQYGQVVCTALYVRLLRSIDRRFDYIFYHVFVSLRSALFYITASSYLQLVRSGLNNAVDAPPDNVSSDISNEATYVMKLSTKTVRDAMLCFHSVGPLEKWRTIAQQVSISNKTGRRIAFASQSV